MAISNVLVIGNRSLSSTIIGALSKNVPLYCISVLTHPFQSPYLPSHVPAETVNHKTSEFSFASLQSAFEGQDIIINTIAGGDYEVQVRVVRAAIAVGVRRYISHEFGQDSLNARLQQRIPRNRERAKVIEYVRSVSSVDDSFEWAAVAVGCILDTALIDGQLGFDMQWQSSTIHGSGKEIFAASSLERVGIVVAKLLQHWEDCKNQYLYAAGTLTSANDVLACLERLSSSTWSVGYSDVEDCVKEGEARIKRGHPDSGMFLLEKSVLCDELLDASASFQKRDANGLLRLESEPVDSIVKKAYHTFQHRGESGCGCG